MPGEHHGLLVVCALLAACGTAARLTRPEGDGGWSAARRQEEIGRRSDAAAAAPAAAPGPLALADALALTERGNRRLAEAADDVAAARERVWQARGRLLPSTTGSGRYTWYTDAQTNSVNFPRGVLPPGVPRPAVTIPG